MAATSELSSLVARLEAVTNKLEGIAAGSGGDDAGASAEFLTAYDDEITNGENTVKFLKLGEEFGGDVAEQIALYKEAIKRQREFLQLVAKYKAPSPGKLNELIKPQANAMVAVVEYFEKHRASKTINHLQAMKEGIQSLGWITAAPKPAPYVRQGLESAQFYTNKILMGFKGKDQKQVDWARSYIASIEDLQKYVKAHHTTGPSWNKNGADPSTAGAKSAAGAAAPPPPPPPAIQPPSDVPAAKSTKDDASDRAALFAAINKGSVITSGLRKVTDDQKTHKNPALRGSSKVEASAAEKKSTATPKAATTAVKKAPVCELQGKKWIVEYQVDNKDIVINAANFHQSVYVFKCEKSTIRVNGKVNFIALDNCKKVAVAFDSVVSSLEVLNCQSIQAQVMQQLPTLSIDKTDGCQVYLSKDSINCEIITAKSSEMNILIPDKSGEFSEHAVAEQFRTKWDGKKLVTVATEINQ